MIGVQYETYVYLGADTVADLVNADFTNTGTWRKVTTDFVTGSQRNGSNVATLTTGKTVLVQYSAAEYGLYEYVGNNAILDLHRQEFADTALWRKLTPDVRTDDGTVELKAGALVANRHVIESLTMQVWDDLEVEATGLFTARGERIAVQSAGSLAINSVTAGGDLKVVAGGDVTLEKNSAITARAEGSDIYVDAGGVLHVKQGSAITSGAAFSQASGAPVASVTGANSTVHLVSGGEMWIAGAVTASRSMTLVVGESVNDFASYFDTLPGKNLFSVAPDATLVATLTSGQLIPELTKAFASRN